MKNKSNIHKYVSHHLHLRLLNTLKNRFYSKILIPNENGCMLWLGSCNEKGYGQFKFNNKQSYAHRFSYELHNAIKIPKDMCVMHSCDNTSCVAPDHLSIGKLVDNVNDMIKKGRNYWSKNPILTLQERKEIYSMIMNGCKIKNIIAKYKVSESTAYKIFYNGEIK